jgi:hypothetical protein
MWTPVTGPIHKFERTVDALFDQTNNGIANTIATINFSLNDLPSYTEFTALYDMYRIDKVEIEFTPEYTELTDAAPVSNAVNVFFHSAVDPAGIGITVLDDILQFRTLKSTQIVKTHQRSVVPLVLLGGLTPVQCWLSTASPSTNHYGLNIAIQACGVTMVFHSRVKFHLSFACSR